jgi:hypothetical protein
LVDEGAESFEVMVVDGLEGERVHGELCGGSGEEALRDIAKELVLRLVLRGSGVIDVRLAGFLALNETFVGHDLKKFKNGGVADGASATDLVMNLADGGGAALPENAEQLEFAFGGAGELERSLHDEDCIRRCS